MSSYSATVAVDEEDHKRWPETKQKGSARQTKIVPYVEADIDRIRDQKTSDRSTRFSIVVYKSKTVVSYATAASGIPPTVYSRGMERRARLCVVMVLALFAGSTAAAARRLLREEPSLSSRHRSDEVDNRRRLLVNEDEEMESIVESQRQVPSGPNPREPPVSGESRKHIQRLVPSGPNPEEPPALAEAGEQVKRIRRREPSKQIQRQVPTGPNPEEPPISDRIHV